VTVDNRLDVKLASARLVVNDEVLELGEIPARETKTFSRRSGPGAATPLKNYVQTHAANFIPAIDARRRAFGDDTRGQINDLINGSMAASFVTLNNVRDNYNNFSTPPGFDLTPLVQRGDAVLLAWAPGHSFTKPLSQFPARRGTKNTLVRVAVQVKN
jgi:hypothetical protein